VNASIEIEIRVFHIVSKSNRPVPQDKASIQRWLMRADCDDAGYSQVAKSGAPGSKDAPDDGGQTRRTTELKAKLALEA
jgi:hypothetical protein